MTGPRPRPARCRAAALLAALSLAGCTANAPQATPLVYGLMGDTPYSHFQANLLEALIDDLNAAPLAFVVHVGDITAGKGPCDDEWMEARQRQFARIRHPFILLPGDNDWSDCHRTGFDPLERLAKWRTLFCKDPAGLRLERQSALHARHAEYCEHVRWRAGDILFIGLNVPGGNNNLGRTTGMDAEYARRMDAVLAWLESGAALAETQGLAGIVVLMQADLRFGEPSPKRRSARDGYAALRRALQDMSERLTVPVVLVHGDTHLFRDDRPLPRLRRIIVEGAPLVGWLRARHDRLQGLSLERWAASVPNRSEELDP